ncbi:MAG TPA: sugar phosphate isomerase/epimerase family protein [Candidatus Hydrogenedentes bacterium]|nr:sugar phosphate isomerase/epimerase family protein [Candidatus Hydrogenedentota bacterium]HPC15417.1 sugar phosphate isomerase/epimerase family protein [Candidatus Hydrogenedentota bacterium]HRT21144.1 sugar phosphate isomerase/epimerase family protein [Candidatus Hydrogenedentota bacterium]HRT64369.1 sugar phosphate isomerase/epimerase family protein [Candidatus Hydrogenedentota bacterium]
MKVGIITASLPMEMKAALRKAKEIGAHGVQLWVANNELDPRNLSQSGRRELVHYMAALGLERSALCGDIGGFADPATVDARIAHTKEMFDLCVDLGTPILTTHIGVVPEDPSGRAYAVLAGAVREVAEYAAARDCCLATETGPESGESLAAFLRSVNSAGAKVNYDPANLCMAGFDPIGDVAVLGEFIVHTHAKDGLRNQPKEVALGKGDVGFPEYLAALRAIGYSGYLTIERECGDDPVADIVEAIAFLKQQEGVDA